MQGPCEGALLKENSTAEVSGPYLRDCTDLLRTWMGYFFSCYMTGRYYRLRPSAHWPSRCRGEHRATDALRPQTYRAKVAAILGGEGDLCGGDRSREAEILRHRHVST